MRVSIRKFEMQDIPYKVKWINDSDNNEFLHYDLPLREDKTRDWFEKNKDRTDRYDAVIELDGIPVCIIGLLGIDRKNSKAEYYVTIGDRNYSGRGIAYEASILLLKYAFRTLGLNRVFLYTEFDNIRAQRLFEKVGFKKEGLCKDDLFSRGRYVSRFIYGISKSDFLYGKYTSTYFMKQIGTNQIYIKRDDLYPFSFGGNKARKGMLFWEELKKDKADCIVTYGSSTSNHCRIISNIAASEGLPCYIVSPEEIACDSCNKRMMEMFGAEIIYSAVSEVHDTIESLLAKLRDQGKNPYFIPGGGHGNIGTQAYVDCYEEIRQYEHENHIKFDYIFFASGTGTTQAGLVCGQLLHNDDRKIIGISIARKCPYGRDIVRNSILDYLNSVDAKVEFDDELLCFDDSYVVDGYGKSNEVILDLIKENMNKYGIPFDATYTGKAFYGMEQYIMNNQIENKRILFIHTGGTPLYFDYLNS